MKKVILTTAAAAFAVAGFAQTTVFDALSPVVSTQFSSTYFYSTASDVYDQWGEAVTLGSSGSTLTGIDFAWATGSNIGSTDVLSAVVQIYGTSSKATSGSSAAFSSLLSTSTISLGSGYEGGGYYVASTDIDPVSGDFTGPNDNFALTSTATTSNTVGVVITFLDNGARTENAGMVFNIGTPNTVGGNSVSSLGLYGANNVASTNGLKGSNYLSDGGSEMELAMTLYATPAPEPVSMSLLGLGVVGLIARKRKLSK